MKYVCPGLIQVRISTIYGMRVWRNDIKRKYTFIFPLKNLACKGLMDSCNLFTHMIQGCLCFTGAIILTHWGRETHLCVSKLTIIGSDNSLAPGRRQTIIWTSADILLFGPRGTNFNENLIGIQIFSFKKMHFKMSSGKCRPFCLGLNVLNLSLLSQNKAQVFTYNSWLIVFKILLNFFTHSSHKNWRT